MRADEEATDAIEDPPQPSIDKFRAFIREYIIDWNGSRAAIRIGVPHTNAANFARATLQKPWVQRELQLYMDRADDKALINRQRVISWLVREANDTGFASNAPARVAALKQLSRILGMDKTRIDLNVGFGVMLVPAHADVDTWEIAATTQQRSLVDKALAGSLHA